MSSKTSPESGDGDYARGSGPAFEVRSARAKLNSGRRQLIRAILDDHEETSFSRLVQMARRYSVDAATIARTVQALGTAVSPRPLVKSRHIPFKDQRSTCCDGDAICLSASR